MMAGFLGFLDDSTELHHCGIASRREEDSIAKMRVVRGVKLVVGHGIVGALEPQHMLGILQCRAVGTGYPQAFGRVAAKSLALVAATAVKTWFAAFLETDDFLLARDVQGKGQVLVEARFVVCCLM